MFNIGLSLEQIGPLVGHSSTHMTEQSGICSMTGGMWPRL
jgi:hypothetical protein